MKATRSFVIPDCSVCGQRCQQDEQGEWFCVACGDDWLARFVENKTHGTSVGGLALPAGVHDERRDDITPSFRDLIPNRRARRAMKRYA
jgi:hypothetical protein